MLERHHRACAAASAFREDDENRFFFLQLLTQICEGVRAAVLSPHRQRVEHDCRKRAGHFRLKEDVSRGDGKCSFSMAGSERCSKSERVEMTAMIRGEHKWPVHRQRSEERRVGKEGREWWG